jgi:hypothetical protein
MLQMKKREPTNNGRNKKTISLVLTLGAENTYKDFSNQTAILSNPNTGIPRKQTADFV